MQSRIGDDAERRHVVPHRGARDVSIRRSMGMSEGRRRDRRRATSAPASRASGPATCTMPNGQTINIRSIMSGDSWACPRRAPATSRSTIGTDHGAQSVRLAQGISSCRPARPAQFYSLPALEQAGLGKVSRLPVSIRIVLESVLRNCDGKKVTEEHVQRARRTGRRPRARATRSRSSSRASCCRTSPACRCSPTSRRCATSRSDLGKNPKTIEPLVPVDLVVDHSVKIDYYGTRTRSTST